MVGLSHTILKLRSLLFPNMLTLPMDLNLGLKIYLLMQMTPKTGTRWFELFNVLMLVVDGAT